MLAIFVRFLHECYDVPTRGCASASTATSTTGSHWTRSRRWWLNRLALPTECLRKAVVNRPSRASHGRHNVLLYGTARVVVNSTAIVQSIYGAIQEYAGIERPEWLDCAWPIPAPVAPRPGRWRNG